MFDWRNHADVTIVIGVASVAAIVSGTVITGGAVVIIGSVVGVPTVIGIPAIVFVRRPGAQETPWHWVLLGRLIVILLFRGGVMPFSGHVVIFIFRFPVEEELEVLTVDQGLVIL
jgi:hypothetical protein